MTVHEIYIRIDSTTPFSAWKRGVKLYALEMLEEIEWNHGEKMEFPMGPREGRALLLNGAPSWSAYSWGGCALIYNGDIAERLCCPSEYKKTREGERRPNAQEEWLDVQTRALFQAANLIYRTAKEETK